MKKMITILIISVMIGVCGYVQASTTFELSFRVLNNKKSERFDLYILLPKEYIEFAIKEANLEIDYEGVSTIKENTIPGIFIEKSKVQDEVYTENDQEYVPIRLEKENQVYSFEILKNYPKMDIKYRIKNIQKDYIVHIDNFKIESGKCEIEYDYQKDTIKQPDKKIMPTGVKILTILLVFLIIVSAIARAKARKN
ncbi:MAG: hypothetical protein HFJ33_06970 [Clostridia bacterium]|nr:hypothetical protein [Clostridia bacterium]